ncbi:pilus assembly protein PilM [Cohnella fermenti]|uniref:pilus assembly protein PilM n=1 Tax=Cohnella fermenti TaxID=2565925 RepID=UPI001454C22E|nr:pilus assembly protein PilM [Cohnella fermenti]
MTIGPSGARLVKLRKKRHWTIESSGVLPLSPDAYADEQLKDTDDLRRQLKRWVRRMKLTGSPVVIPIQTSQAIIRRIQIQTTNRKDLHQLVALEVETALHLPFEDPVYDYVVVGEEENATQVLVFAASRQLIEQQVKLVESAGLKVRGVELSATALARAIRTLDRSSFQETLLVNQEPDSLEIYMFYQGQPVFVRSISLFSALDDGGQLSPSQLGEMTAEISRMLNFYQFSIHEGQSRIAEARIAGSKAVRDQLCAALQELQPDMDVRTISFQPYAPGKRDESYADGQRVAIGLALWPNEEKRINLLPKVDREAKVAPYALAGTLLVWVLCLAAMLYYYYDSRSELQAGKRQADELQLNLASLENGIIAQQKPKDGATDPSQAVVAIRNNRRVVTDVLAELKEKLPAGAVIRTLNYNASSQIGLTVTLNRPEDVSRYLYELRRMSFAEDATLQSVVEEKAASAAADLETSPLSATKLTAVYAVPFKKPEGGAKNAADGNQ